MITNSKSYLNLKNQIQNSIDFSVLCCHAIPSLNRNINQVQAEKMEKLPDPHYFKSVSSNERLKELIPSYRKQLGKFLLISTFSYFESYIENLISEIALFHFNNIDIKKNQEKLVENSINNSEIKIKTKYLKENIKSSNLDKYRNITAELQATNFLFPSDYFKFIGINKFIKIARDNYSFKASEIPDVLEDLFFLKLNQVQIDMFNKIRDKRNKIAHGNSIEIEFKEANKYNKFLRNLALQIDKHSVDNFLVIDLNNELNF